MLKFILSVTLLSGLIGSAFASEALDGRWVMEDKARCALSGKVTRKYNKETMTRRVVIDGNHLFYGYLTLDRTPVRMNFEITDLSEKDTFRVNFLDGDVEKKISFGQLTNGKLYLIFEDSAGEFCSGGLVVTTLGKI